MPLGRGQEEAIRSQYWVTAVELPCEVSAESTRMEGGVTKAQGAGDRAGGGAVTCIWELMLGLRRGRRGAREAEREGGAVGRKTGISNQCRMSLARLWWGRRREGVRGRGRGTGSRRGRGRSRDKGGAREAQGRRRIERRGGGCGGSPGSPKGVR